MSVIRQSRLVTAAVGRKLWMLSQRVPRVANRIGASDDDYRQRPPVVVTTLPKSGTHLVHQIVTALPGTVDYGTFLATRASYRRKPRTTSAVVRRIKGLAPGEIVRAHLVHRPEVVEALRSKRAFIIFVCRDPRDTIVSQAHYLSDSALWHPAHRRFSRLTPEERIDISIQGLPGQEEVFPDARRRLDYYAKWLEDADVTLKFEDLVGDTRLQAIETVIRRYEEIARGSFDVGDTTTRAVAAINPERSHTYREGQVGSWREMFTPHQIATFEAVVGDLLQRYGYPQAEEVESGA